MMPETIQMLREVWALPETSYQGVRVSLRDLLWVWPDDREAQFRPDIPIYIGATGPKMTALAGSRADGLVIEMSKLISEIENQAHRSNRPEDDSFSRKHS